MKINMISSELNIDSPVYQFVNKFPNSITILQNLGIDFCCGGQDSLAKACSEKGLDPKLLLERLCTTYTEKKSNDHRDWSKATLTEIVDHLELTHHVYVKETLPRLTDLMTRVVGAHGENHPEVLRLDEYVREIVADLGPHLMKEEQILFPAIKQMDLSLEEFHCGSIQNPIQVMKIDHDNIGKIFLKIRELTKDFNLPKDACNTWRALHKGLEDLEKDTHLHIHKENNVLFPMVVEAEQNFKNY
jgi:regulator of cell morphogenesis and NO signaling